MKRLGKTLGSAFAVLVLVLVLGITFTVGWHPFIGPRARPLTARKFQSTPQRLARGKYIAEHTSDCWGATRNTTGQPMMGPCCPIHSARART